MSGQVVETAGTADGEEMQVRRLLRLRHRAIRLLQDEIVRLQGPILPADAPGAQFVPVEIERPGGAPRGTIFAFSGLRVVPGETAAEFRRVLADSAFVRVFVKDLSQVWYQHGLPGLGADRDTAFAALGARLADLPRPWICIGNSAGGHAAIHAGRIMAADRVEAFAPQTEVTRVAFLQYAREVPRMRDFRVDDPGNDLLRVLAGPARPVPTRIAFGRRNRSDAAHARRLAGLPGVTLLPVETGTHAVAARLKSDGRLLPLIEEGLA